jgi:hypothetical protein
MLSRYSARITRFALKYKVCLQVGIIFVLLRIRRSATSYLIFIVNGCWHQLSSPCAIGFLAEKLILPLSCFELDGLLTSM